MNLQKSTKTLIIISLSLKKQNLKLFSVLIMLKPLKRLERKRRRRNRRDVIEKKGFRILSHLPGLTLLLLELATLSENFDKIRLK